MNAFSSLEYIFNKKPNAKDNVDIKILAQVNIDKNKEQLLSTSSRPKRIRKHTFNTRSVWYDDDEFDNKFFQQSPTFSKSGFQLRKASSLDSLLVEKDNKQRLKITKDMISAPISMQKIVGEWTNIKEKINHTFPIPEENESHSLNINESGRSGESEQSDSDSVSDSSSASLTQQEIDGDVKLEKLKITKDVISAPVSAQKIVGEWGDVKENIHHFFPIPEENGEHNSNAVTCEDIEVNLQDVNKTLHDLNTSNSEEIRTESAEQHVYIRKKTELEESDSSNKDRRKNILLLPLELNNRDNRLLATDVRSDKEVHEPIKQNVIEDDNNDLLDIDITNIKEVPELKKQEVIENSVHLEKSIDNTNNTDIVLNAPIQINSNFVDTAIDDNKVNDNTDLSNNQTQATVVKEDIPAEIYSRIEVPAETCNTFNNNANEQELTSTESTDLSTNKTKQILQKEQVSVESSSRTVEVINTFNSANEQEFSLHKTELKENNVGFDAIKPVGSIENAGLTVSSVMNTLENLFPKEFRFDKKIIKEKSSDFVDPITRRIKKQRGKAKESGGNLMKMKGFSKSSDALNNFKEPDAEEVLRTLQSNKDEPLSRSVGPFPKTDDTLFGEEVQLRVHRTDGIIRQSQTVGCDPRRLYRNQDFEVRGCVKIYLCPDNKEIKLKKNEYIQYTNTSIIRCDPTRCELLKSGVYLKSIKLTNKKEIELRDIHNQLYIIVFDSSKDAKLFVESEKVACYTDSEKSTITKTLLRLLGKRSSKEVLEKRGIYQNEPIFGNTLRNIYNAEHSVPRFILKTMELIERPDNITSLGLYRTSGNLATIQKIRLEVDKGNLDILENYAKDPDVLTGSLKLFFRELKEPLLSCKTCDNLLGFTKNDMNYGKKDRDNIRTILTHIPEANSETLLALIKHLVKIVEYKEQNKMDTYNLAVCWGPTIIFATDNTITKDLVTQSAEATKLFDALLNFYINNPEELELRKKKQDVFDTNRNMIHRQDSKDSIQSSDSSHSSKNKSSSNLSLDAIDDVIRKSVELIESHINSEGLYRKNGSPEKVNKILKKMIKRKLADLEKYKHDVYDMTDALKKYLQDGCDSLVTRETVELVNKLCDNTQWLEHNARQRVITVVAEVPKKDALIFLIRHVIKLIKYESSHNVPKAEMIQIWSRILNDQMRIIDSEEKMTNFLRILVEVFDESKPDVVTVMPKGMSNGLLNDLKNLQKEKDRISKYDNVPDETDFNTKEATIVEEKTEEIEHTKL